MSDSFNIEIGVTRPSEDYRQFYEALKRLRALSEQTPPSDPTWIYIDAAREALSELLEMMK
jgi:hypothetical protein